jgi:hypothetical protein
VNPEAEPGPHFSGVPPGDLASNNTRSGERNDVPNENHQATK